jgi:hypothetical protein
MTALSIMTLGIMTFIITLSNRNTWYSDTQHKDINTECHYAECHKYAESLYGECHYAECRYAGCRGAMKSKWRFTEYPYAECC